MFMLPWLILLALPLLIIGIILVVLLIVAAVRRSWKFALWSVGGTGVSALAVVGLWLLAFWLAYRPYDPTSASDLADTYEADFFSPAPAGVKVLKARQYIFGDSGSQWLLFQATPEEIEKHIAMGFKATPNPPADFRPESSGNSPAWWQPPLDQLEFYENGDWLKEGVWIYSRAEMGIDRKSGLIWFSTSRVH